MTKQTTTKQRERFTQNFHTTVQILRRLANRTLRKHARSRKLSASRAETLQLLFERGTLSTTAIAKELGLDPSTVTRNLSKLTSARLTARSSDSDGVFYHLTMSGHTVANALKSDALALYGEVFDLGLHKQPEALAFFALLEDVAQRLQKI